MRGRHRKPTNLKRLQGTWRADRANPNEPEPKPLEKADPPEWLDNYARECWEAHVPHLIVNGLLTSLSVHFFAAVCERWSTYRRACDELKGSLTHTTEANGSCAKPQIAIAKAAFDQFRQGMQEFGMTPATTGKVTANRPEEDDPIAKYLSGNPRVANARRFLA